MLEHNPFEKNPQVKLDMFSPILLGYITNAKNQTDATTDSLATQVLVLELSSSIGLDIQTVDGRIPAPSANMANIPSFTGLYTSQVVVWDFFHQQ